MIDKLIEKYKAKLEAQEDIILRIDSGEFSVDSDINLGQIKAYQEILQDLEKLKQSILNHDDLSINNEIGKIILIDTLIGVDTDE